MACPYPITDIILMRVVALIEAEANYDNMGFGIIVGNPGICSNNILHTTLQVRLQRTQRIYVWVWKILTWCDGDINIADAFIASKGKEHHGARGK
jgi:hypothetical protein